MVGGTVKQPTQLASPVHLLLLASGVGDSAQKKTYLDVASPPSVFQTLVIIAVEHTKTAVKVQTEYSNNSTLEYTRDNTYLSQQQESKGVQLPLQNVSRAYTNSKCSDNNI
jgi:hypothetical protein